jgi:hypothetical protein
MSWASRLGGEVSSLIGSSVVKNPAMSREPAEVQQAVETVSQAVAPLRASKHITWILDRGFDDMAVWRTIWQYQDHVVSRVYHTDRRVEFQDRARQWQKAGYRPSLLASAPVSPCRNECAGAARQASAPQEPAGRGRALDVPIALDLLEPWAWPRAGAKES